ncbi:hypothetical protein SAMN05216419_100645 [Nitrosomonas cryotolerans]|uniref:Adhesin n=1 Tax=Nitrosomonas cryotolerans ATCC 49181 TaxID=1131553 RepID=A0A1N6IZQ0_9PROT|nr:hypothetical protein [Nitrosomonas cryotolerans]SFP54385.1 hypothetical protein SAMN05216419_100645 [Nitrosomonas cryotolerans]SIO37588.1 hypothetical protein SAMN02743940_2208 [Nitrosomonas cryotolerans ATCC 49181]
MKFSKKTRKAVWVYLLSFTFIMSLSACDDSSKPTNNRKLPTGPTTGILTDALISGVSYTTSSGKAGITNDQGIYDYNHGDTVEFKLGHLTLANIQATPIVTPVALADGSDNKLQNLLVLLQSLDSDGNPANGISILADTAAAVSASINLDSDPATFVDSTKLQTILEAGGIKNTAKTAEEANAHFLSQGLNLLSTNIWVQYDDKNANVIRIATDNSGEYLQGVATPDDSCDENRVCGGNTIIKAGVEYGVANVLDFDTRGFKIIGIPTIDTNLQAGLSHPRPTWRIHTDGFELITSDIVTVQRKREQSSLFGELFHVASPIVLSSDDEPILTDVSEKRYNKMDNISSGIVGAWVLDQDSIKTKTLLFFPNKKFMLIDPTGETHQSEQSECGMPGVEFASYDYDTSAKTLTISSYSYDTNGCAGFSETSGVPLSFTINTEGNLATLNKQDKEFTLYRVSR